MTPQTLWALNASIEKWWDNIHVTSLVLAKTHWTDCPLCTLFHQDQCRGCPVAAKSGSTFCDGTPYTRAYTAKDQGDICAFVNIAAEEHAFLVGLLPETVPTLDS